MELNTKWQFSKLYPSCRMLLVLPWPTSSLGRTLVKQFFPENYLGPRMGVKNSLGSSQFSQAVLLSLQLPLLSPGAPGVCPQTLPARQTCPDSTTSCTHRKVIKSLLGCLISTTKMASDRGTKASQEGRGPLWMGILKRKVKRSGSLVSLLLFALLCESQNHFMLALSSSWLLLLSLNLLVLSM